MRQDRIATTIILAVLMCATASATSNTFYQKTGPGIVAGCNEAVYSYTNSGNPWTSGGTVTQETTYHYYGGTSADGNWVDSYLLKTINDTNKWDISEDIKYWVDTGASVAGWMSIQLVGASGSYLLDNNTYTVDESPWYNYTITINNSDVTNSEVTENGVTTTVDLSSITPPYKIKYTIKETDGGGSAKTLQFRFYDTWVGKDADIYIVDASCADQEWTIFTPTSTDDETGEAAFVQDADIGEYYTITWNENQTYTTLWSEAESDNITEDNVTEDCIKQIEIYDQEGLAKDASVLLKKQIATYGFTTTNKLLSPPNGQILLPLEHNKMYSVSFSKTNYTTQAYQFLANCYDASVSRVFLATPDSATFTLPSTDCPATYNENLSCTYTAYSNALSTWLYLNVTITYQNGSTISTTYNTTVSGYATYDYNLTSLMTTMTLNLTADDGVYHIVSHRYVAPESTAVDIDISDESKNYPVIFIGMLLVGLLLLGSMMNTVVEGSGMWIVGVGLAIGGIFAPILYLILLPIFIVKVILPLWRKWTSKNEE